MAAQSGGVRMVDVVWLGSNVRVGSFELAWNPNQTCMWCSLDYLCCDCSEKLCGMVAALVKTLSERINVAPHDIKLLAERESSHDLSVYYISQKIRKKTMKAWARLLSATSPQTQLKCFVTSRSNVDLAVNKLLIDGDYRSKCGNYGVWRFRDMSLDLRSNVRVVRVAVDIFADRCWEFVGEDLLSNKAFMMQYILKRPEILKHASDNLKKDIDVVLAAVTKNGKALQWASEKLRGNKDVVLASVISNGSVLKWASEKLRGDKEVVLAAVTNNGRALQWAYIHFRDDKDVVLAAVSSNGNALQYASLELRGDRDVVSAAVRSNGQALQWARDDLRKDNDLIFLALETDPTAVKHSDCQHQFEFWAAACFVNGKAFAQIPWTDPERRHTVRLMIQQLAAPKPSVC